MHKRLRLIAEVDPSRLCLIHDAHNTNARQALDRCQPLVDRPIIAEFLERFKTVGASEGFGGLAALHVDEVNIVGWKAREDKISAYGQNK